MSLSVAHQLRFKVKTFSHKSSLGRSVCLQYTQYAPSLSILLNLSLQDKLMTPMRIKTEGERGKDREGRRQKGKGGKQSDVALPSPWQ